MSNTTRLGVLMCLFLIGLTGCPDPEQENNDNNTNNEIDMALDIEKDIPLTCQPGFMACGNACTRVDENNCGACGRSCGRGALCNTDEGTCGCLNGGSWCGIGQCLKTLNDSNNCGECGKKCPAANYCVDGQCVENGEIAEVVNFTNLARSKARNCDDVSFEAAPPLMVNNLLNVAAQNHAEDMADRNYFEHDAPPPKASTPTQRMRAAGYQGRTTGENIARGQRTPEEVVQAWIDSPGHCKNIMSPGYTEIGVGFFNNGKYWVQNFGKP